MQLAWSVLGPQCLYVYGLYRQLGPQALATSRMHYRQAIYTHAYRPSCARAQVPPNDPTMAASVKIWDDSVVDTAFGEIFNTPMAQGQTRSIQGRQGGITTWAKSAQEAAALDSKDALLTTYATGAGAVVSRFQILTTYHCVGLALFHRLNFDDYTADPVNQWKVMAPELGATGPDSAVFYLTASLADGRVQALAQRIGQRLKKFLDTTATCPFGQQKVHPGVDAIFGVDLPPAHYQSTVLALGHGSAGSAGMVISSIVDLVAYRAARDLPAQPAKDPAGQPWTDASWVKAYLSQIVVTDLGWQLV